MAYRVTLSLSLGAARTGLTLKAQLIDPDGDPNGSEITTGFYEIGEGRYLWDYASVPDEFYGGVLFYTGTAPGTLQESTSISPAKAAPANYTSLAISSSGVVDANVEQVNGDAYTPATSVDVSSDSLADIATDVATAVLVTPANKLATDSSGRVTAGTVSDKTGYALTQAFPTDFDKIEVGADGKFSANTLSNAPGSDAGAIEIEAGIDLQQAIAVILSAVAGKVSGAGTGTIVFKGANNDDTRITATTDSQGNRTVVTLTLPS